MGSNEEMAVNELLPQTKRKYHRCSSFNANGTLEASLLGGKSVSRLSFEIVFVRLGPSLFIAWDKIIGKQVLRQELVSDATGTCLRTVNAGPVNTKRFNTFEQSIPVAAGLSLGLVEFVTEILGLRNGDSMLDLVADASREAQLDNTTCLVITGTTSNNRSAEIWIDRDSGHICQFNVDQPAVDQPSMLSDGDKDVFCKTTCRIKTSALE